MLKGGLNMDTILFLILVYYLFRRLTRRRQQRKQEQKPPSRPISAPNIFTDPLDAFFHRSSPWYAKRSILSERELENYRNLYRAAAPLGLEVFTKVRLLDLLLPLDEFDDEKKSLVWAKHVDFVVWSPPTNSVICVLELLDKTHYQPARKKRDAFVRQVLEDAGYLYKEYPVFDTQKLSFFLKNQLNMRPTPRNDQNLEKGTVV